MQDERAIRDQRHLAQQKVNQVFEQINDTKSGPVYAALVEMQDHRLATGLTEADFKYLIGALYADVDQIVVCRAIGILIGQQRQGRLSPVQLATCKSEAKRLYGYRDWVGRGYAFAWSGQLGDLTAIPGLEENVRTESNPQSRSKAEQALVKLRGLKTR
jgi:hypothetical protein